MTTYYVDARNGSDSNSGQGSGKAWKTIEHVNDQDLDPGDKVLFRSGNVYTQTLEPASSGSSSNPITFGSYGSGAKPVFAGRGDLSYGIKIDGVNHIRLQNLEVRDCDQGVMVYQSRGVQLVGLDVHDNARNGIHLKDSHNARLEGGSSHDNGRDSGTHLGHGVLMSDGASGNLVRGMALYRNAEDGVQFGPDSGDQNRIVNNVIHGNLEDGIDIKNGDNLLSKNYIHSNAVNAVFVHKNSGGDTTTLVDNHLKATKGHALDIDDNARGVSRDNIYEDGNSLAIRVHGGARMSHDNDTIINFGTYKGEVNFSLAQTTSTMLSAELETSPSGSTATGVLATSPTDPIVVDPTAVVSGTSRADGAVDGSGDQEIFGTSGDDLLRGGGGDDTVAGGRGEDFMSGGEGRDLLKGRNGHDRLEGDGGSDILRGGRGHDVLDGGQGDDVLNGGPGDDVVTGGGGADRFVVTPHSGSETIVDFYFRADSIDLRGWSARAEEEMMATARQVGADVRIDLQDGRLTIQDTDVADLLASMQAVSATHGEGAGYEHVPVAQADEPAAQFVADLLDT